MARVTGIGGFFFREDQPPRRRLGARVARLRAAGIGVEPHAEEYPNGRFAELEDPEGNRIQLWEPNVASIARDPGPR